MKLYFDDLEIEVPVKTKITPKLKVRFNELVAGLNDFYSDTEGLINSVEFDEKGEPVIKSASALLEFYKSQGKAKDVTAVAKNDSLYIQLAKEILNSKTLDEEQIKLIESEPESDFWQNQDMNEIIKGVQFFRSTIMY